MEKLRYVEQLLIIVIMIKEELKMLWI